MLTTRHTDVDSQQHFHGTKTPGRTLKGRAALQENAVRGSMTVNGKGKRAYPNTPLRPETLQPERLFKHVDGPSKSFASSVSRPLADKTPFPNQQKSTAFFTPHPRNEKIAKLPLLPLIDEPMHNTPAPPPSSTRKKQRIPRSASKSFETPITKGDHWNVSDISIDVASTSLQEVIEEDGTGPDYSDPEYMPPTAIIPPYEPSFEMPDYKKVGASLLSVACSYPVGDEIPSFDYEFSSGKLQEAGWMSPTGNQLQLPELDDDDPFTSDSKIRSARTRPDPSATESKRQSRFARPAPLRTGVPSSDASLARAPGTLMRPPTAVRPVSALQTTRPMTSMSATNVRRPVSVAAGTSSYARKPVLPASKTTAHAAGSRANSSTHAPTKPTANTQSSARRPVTSASATTTTTTLMRRPTSTRTPITSVLPVRVRTGAAATVLPNTANKNPPPNAKTEGDDIVLRFDVDRDMDDFHFEV